MGSHTELMQEFIAEIQMGYHDPNTCLAGNVISDRARKRKKKKKGFAKVLIYFNCNSPKSCASFYQL